MICKECKEQNLKSTMTVVAVPSKVEPKKVKEFWDENGMYHYHDSNVHTKVYACSNGHTTIDHPLHGCPQCGDSWREQENKDDTDKGGTEAPVGSVSEG